MQQNNLLDIVNGDTQHSDSSLHQQNEDALVQSHLTFQLSSEFYREFLVNQPSESSHTSNESPNSSFLSLCDININKRGSEELYSDSLEDFEGEDFIQSNIPVEVLPNYLEMSVEQLRELISKLQRRIEELLEQ